MYALKYKCKTNKNVLIIYCENWRNMVKFKKGNVIKILFTNEKFEKDGKGYEKDS